MNRKQLLKYLLSIWFITDSEPKWCCYYHMSNWQDIFSDGVCIIHYDWDLWVEITLEDVKSILSIK